MTLCIYALATPVAGSLRRRGLEHEPLQIVTVGRVSAVVGELPRRPSATHDVLARYDAVVGRLAERYTALLPARFATCVDRDELMFILRSRQQALRRALRHVRGRAQMTVRLVSDTTDVAPDSPSPAGKGIDYLRRRAAEAAVPAFEPLRVAVKKWVRDERVEKRRGIATVYHLIPRGATEAYRRAMIARAGQVDLRAIVSGPFPPYAFTE